jgi:hypothetical protein
MDLEQALKSVNSIRSAFDDMVSHGQPDTKDAIIVSVPRLVSLETMITTLQHALAEAVRPAPHGGEGRPARP